MTARGVHRSVPPCRGSTPGVTSVNTSARSVYHIVLPPTVAELS